METKVNDNGSGDEKVLLLDAKALAMRLGVSKTTIWRLRDSGSLPQPVRMGSLVRWRVEDITAWIHDRCPKLDGRNSE